MDQVPSLAKARTVRNKGQARKKYFDLCSSWTSLLRRGSSARRGMNVL